MPESPRRWRRQSAFSAYTHLLRLYPRVHRQTFGPQMLQAFADHYRDAVEEDGQRASRFWLGVVTDESKSLLREHLAALTERTALMKPSRLIALVVGVLLVLFDVSTLVGHPRAGMALASLLVIPIYVAVFFLLARLVPVASRDAARPPWWRLAVLLGGIVSLYVVALLVLGALIPLPAQFAHNPGDFRYSLAQVWVLGMLLLAGAVGIIGGAATGSEQAGALLGLVTGFFGLVVRFISQALLVVLLWNALQHHQLQSSLAVDYQQWLQVPNQTLTLGSFVYWELFGDGVALAVVFSVLFLAVQGVGAAIGGALGAGAFRRAGNPAAPEAQPASTPGRVRFLRLSLTFSLTMLGLGLLTWGLYAGVSLVGGGPFSAFALGATFASPAFVAWLFAGLAVVVAVLVTARSTPLQREVHTATSSE